MNFRAYLYLLLRLLNTALGLVWGFALMAVMIRTIGVDRYSYYVIIGAIGIYIASVDLGISNVLYARLREAFFKNTVSDLAAPARGSIAVYVAVAIFATLLYAVYLALAAPPAAGSAWALFLFFAATLANFPWIVLRAVVAAVDGHLHFEAIDFFRRAGQLLCFGLLLLMGDLEATFLLLDLIWLVAYVLLFRDLRTCGIGGIDLRPRHMAADLRAFVTAFGGMILHSAVFVLSEAFIYNYPYALLPVIYGAGVEIVLFDVFYKFLRAAITANQVASMGLLPQISRWHFAGDRPRLMHTLAAVFGLSLAAMVAMNLILHFGRDHIFAALLRENADLITPTIVAAIAIITIANALQNTAGSYIVNIGKVRLAKSLGLFMVFSFSAATVAAYLTDVGFDGFILIYSLVYLFGALAWGWKAAMIVTDVTAVPVTRLDSDR